MTTFGSVCSGIEAASVAWHPLGWKAAWLSEIEPFPCAVLAHHYPDVPNLGDMTKLVRKVLGGEIEAPDVFTGGTPCQAFSVAGKRQSLDDARGNLTLTFVEIADAIDHIRASRGDSPAVVVWENVPGVLSTKDNAFGCFLGALAGAGCELQPAGGRWTDAGCVYGPARAVAWRVLDAQYFGLAQRRRRVFVVASARKGFDPATVLFEWDSVRRDTAPSREARQTAPTIPARSTAGGGLGTDFDCDGGTICVATGQAGAEIGADMAQTLNCNHEAPYVAHSLRGEGFDASEDGTGRGTPLVPVVAPTLTSNGDAHSGYRDEHGLVPVAFPANLSGTQCASTENLSPALGAVNPTAVAIQDVRGTDKAQNGRGWNDEGTAYTLDTHATQGVAYAVALRGREGGATAEMGDEVQNCLRASSGGGDKPHVLTAMQVRRLTVVECERLMGFPDGYTAIPWRKKPASDCPDGPRYRALGNSWAVPVAAWVGKRIQEHIDGRN